MDLLVGKVQVLDHRLGKSFWNPKLAGKCYLLLIYQLVKSEGSISKARWRDPVVEKEDFRASVDET